MNGDEYGSPIAYWLPEKRKAAMTSFQTVMTSLQTVMTSLQTVTEEVCTNY